MGRAIELCLLALVLWLAPCAGPHAPADDAPPADPAEKEEPDQPAPDDPPGDVKRLMQRGRIGLRGNFNFQPPAERADTEGDEPVHGVSLVDNGDLRRRLEQVRLQLAGQHYADAIRQLSHWLQDREIRDFFLNREDQRRGGRSFLTEIRRMIAHLPPAAQATYRLQCEAPARQALSAAVSSGGEAPLRDVIRRFPGTTSADEARFRLGHVLFDHGRPEAAAACFEKLQADASVARTFEPRLSLLLVACWQRAGRPERSRALAQRLREHAVELRVSGAPLAMLQESDLVQERLSLLLSPHGTPRGDRRDWPTFRGDASRNRHAPAAAPLAAARWTVPLTSDGHTWHERDRALEPYCTGRDVYLPRWAPLAVDDVVFVRTARGCAAHSLATGLLLWKHPFDDDEQADPARLIWHESGGGAFSADAECVYLIEVAPGREPDAAPVAAALVARGHAAGGQGKLRWRADGAHEPRLAGAFFLGAPVAARDRLYALVEQRHVISVAALCTRTGRLDWLQEIAVADEASELDPLRRLAGVSPSISDDEILICPTSGGALVAIDLTTQSLLWAYRYELRPAAAAADRALLAPGPRLDQSDRWLDPTATIARQTVVLSPVESSELHAVNLDDGELRWKRPRGDGLFVACATDDIVVVVGRRSVSAYRLSDGEPPWPALVLPDGCFASGRGVSTGDRYFLPVTSAAILELNLLDGKINAEFRSPREIVPGNLIWSSGLFVSQGLFCLQAFDERTTVERTVSETLAHDPDNAAALLRRGELHLAAGRLDEALSDFRRTYQLEPGPLAKSLLTSALLDALRQEGAGQTRLEAELDRLAQPPSGARDMAAPPSHRPRPPQDLRQ
ncbi:MAG: outer membrane protein assembly factor BamB family protein [Planctomycetaceae bacterium]